MQAYGGWLHALVCRRASREMYTGTMFLRNRPALELMRRLTAEKPEGSTVRMAVLACSIGVELYSILWTLRKARPDLTFAVVGSDMSEELLRIAENGTYGPQSSEFVNAAVFERLTEHEERELFDWEGDQAQVKSWIREGITWRVADASDPELSPPSALRTSWSRTTSCATWTRRVRSAVCGTSRGWWLPADTCSSRASISTCVRKSRSSSAGSRSRS